MKFVICINNEGFEDSLQSWKVYQSQPNAGDQKVGLLRMIDETGEDYLFPNDFFQPIEVNETVRKAFEESHEVAA